MSKRPIPLSESEMKQLAGMVRKQHDEQQFDWQEDYEATLEDVENPENYTLEQHIEFVCLLDVDMITEHYNTEGWSLNDWFLTIVANYYGSDHATMLHERMQQ